MARPMTARVPGADPAKLSETRAPPENALIEQGYARLAASKGAAEQVAVAARLILDIFDDFYRRLNEYGDLAKRSFEHMDPHAAILISQERLHLYSQYIAAHGPRIRAACPEMADSTAAWEALDITFSTMIVDRYEADIAFSFAHSLRRNIGRELWRPVAYAFPPPSTRRELSMASVYQRLPVRGALDAQLFCLALQAPAFTIGFRNLGGDAQRILARVQRLFENREPAAPSPKALDVVQAGFFRDRTAYVVARWQLTDGSFLPLVIALRNGPEGIYADAVLHHAADIHNLFSSTLANLHVTTRLYYQTCVFLYSLMPLRPLGHHYSTIGYNHVGKVAILDEIFAQMRASGQRFSRSPGAPGTVALGFTFDACSYHLKIIRDRPTAAYKWGTYPGTRAVLEKYRVVHELDRAGSMLDNVMYFNLRLERSMFEPELLEEIRTVAAQSVQVDDEGVLVRSLIVQLRIVPLPVYLTSARHDQIVDAMVSLGRCIRNNAAINVFNRDLDSRNYGVGRYGRIFLFDYDAVEKLTDVKIRTNTDREPGEEALPDWVFEDGTIFLPEEIDYGMQFGNTFALQTFREVNGDLLGVQYWEAMQQSLQRGEVPELSMYPQSCRLG